MGDCVEFVFREEAVAAGGGEGEEKCGCGCDCTTVFPLALLGVAEAGEWFEADVPWSGWDGEVEWCPFVLSMSVI